MSADVLEQEVELDGLEEHVNRRFWPLLADEHRYLVLMGGAGSGKSRFCAQKIVLRCVMEPGHRFLVLRKVARTMRRSCFQEVIDAIADLGWQGTFEINRTDLTLTCVITGSIVLFAGLDDVEKLKSIASITSVWIEEATEVSESDFNQIDLRLRGRTRFYKQIMISFNPVSVYHWLKRRFYDTPDRAGSVRCVHSTYLQNRFLDSEYRATLEGYKEVDETFWRVYAKGEWGVFKGLIYTPWPNAESWPASFDDEFRGLDFGFNNPSALIHFGERDAALYATEELYESGLTTRALGERMQAMGVNRRTPIYADAAEPDRIEELCRMGFNVVPADKGPGSVAAGILSVKAKTIYTKPENANLNRELSTYKWAEDKDGKNLDVPVKINDHLMDAARYAIHTHRAGGVVVGGGWDVLPHFD